MFGKSNDICGELEEAEYLLDDADYNKLMSDVFEQSYMMNATGLTISAGQDPDINTARGKYKEVCAKYEKLNKEATETQSCISWFKNKFISLCNLLAGKISALIKDLQSLINSFLDPINEFIEMLKNPLGDAKAAISKIIGKYLYIPDFAEVINTCMTKLGEITKNILKDLLKMDETVDEAEEVNKEVNDGDGKGVADIKKKTEEEKKKEEENKKKEENKSEEEKKKEEKKKEEENLNKTPTEKAIEHEKEKIEKKKEDLTPADEKSIFQKLKEIFKLIKEIITGAMEIFKKLLDVSKRITKEGGILLSDLMKWITDTANDLAKICGKLTQAAMKIVAMLPKFALKLAQVGAELAIEKMKRIKRIWDEEAKEKEEKEQAEKAEKEKAEKEKANTVEKEKDKIVDKSKEEKTIKRQSKNSPEAVSAEAELEDAVAKGTSDASLDSCMNKVKESLQAVGDAISEFTDMISDFTSSKGNGIKKLTTKTSTGKEVKTQYTIPELIEKVTEIMSKLLELTTKIVKLVTTIPEKLIEFVKKIGNCLEQTISDALACPFK